MNTEKIKQLIHDRGLSVNRLAKLSGVPEPTVRRIVTDPDANPTIKQVKKLAEALEVSIDDIA